MKNKTLTLTAAEYEHLTVTLECVVEELEELMKEHEYYVTELSDRTRTCIEIIERAT